MNDSEFNSSRPNHQRASHGGILRLARTETQDNTTFINAAGDSQQRQRGGHNGTTQVAALPHTEISTRDAAQMVIMVARLAHWPVNRDADPFGGTVTMGITAI